MAQTFAGDLFAMTNDAEVDMGNIENALNSLKSSFSGPTAPSAEQGQLWYDTTRSLLRHRGASSQWRGVIAFKDAAVASITKMWVYSNAAEEGFTEYTNCADSVIALKGGSNAYNVTGGDGTKRGVWAISDLIADTTHEHSGPSHYHAPITGSQIANRVAISTSSGQVMCDEGPDASGYRGTETVAASGSSSNVVRQIGKNTDYSGTASTTGNTGHTHNGAGTWRPQAAVGIMIYPAVI